MPNTGRPSRRRTTRSAWYWVGTTSVSSAESTLASVKAGVERPARLGATRGRAGGGSGRAAAGPRGASTAASLHACVLAVPASTTESWLGTARTLPPAEVEAFVDELPSETLLS